MTDNQDYDNVHLYVPNLKNYDGYGGKRRSEMMVTSVDQTVTGKKIFSQIEMGGDLNANEYAIKSLKFDTDPKSAARIQELELKFNKHGGTMYGPIDMNEHEITNLHKNPSLDYEA